MRYIATAAFASMIVAALGVPLAAAPIVAGHIVNVRVGDGTTTPAGTGLPVTLDDYQVNYIAGVPTSVTLMQSIALPGATSGTPPTSGNRWLTQGGTAAGEGGLTTSLNGQYMALGGYNNVVGGVTNGTGNSGQRVVGLLNVSSGLVDTTTDYADAPTASAIRNAYTTNGTDVWTANSTAGTRYVTAGGSTSVALTGTSAERRVYVYPTSGGNQLYVSRMSGFFGPGTVGSPPPPTSGAQTVTGLPGFTVAANSIYDYWFADSNTLYVVDDRNTTSGGLEKWTFNGSTWSMVFNKSSNGGTSGLKSLAGMVDASGNVVLFAAQTGTGANKLFGYTDTLGNALPASVTENLLVDASSAFTGTAWNLRGVAIAPAVPEPTTFSLLAFGVAGMLARRARR
jgi:hypothetical protein